MKSQRKIILTELEQTRRLPNFDTRFAFDEIKSRLTWVAVIASILYWGYSLLSRGAPNKYGWILPFLCIAAIPSWTIFMFLKSVVKAFSMIVRKRTGRRKWLNEAGRAKAIIVEKRTREGYEDDEGREGYSHKVIYAELKLKYSPILAISYSSEQTFWAGIGHSDYGKLELGDTVDIYYSITDPSMFLIEGEQYTMGFTQKIT